MFGIGGSLLTSPCPPPKGEWVAIIFVGFSFDLPLPPPKGEWVAIIFVGFSFDLPPAPSKGGMREL